MNKLKKTICYNCKKHTNGCLGVHPFREHEFGTFNCEDYKSNIAKEMIYICSPYKSDLCKPYQPYYNERQMNAEYSLHMFSYLHRQGYLVYAPLVHHFNPMRDQLSEKEWLAYDLEILEKCDILLICKPTWVKEYTSGMLAEINKANELEIKVIGCGCEPFDAFRLLQEHKQE